MTGLHYLAFLAAISPVLTAQLSINPPTPVLTDGNSGAFMITDKQNRQVKFRYLGVSRLPSLPPSLDSADNIVILSMEKGTTPARVRYVFHPVKELSRANLNLYLHFVTVDRLPEEKVFGQLDYRPTRYDVGASIIRVVNTYSMEEIVVPGSFMSIYSNYIPQMEAITDFDYRAKYPTQLNNVQVRFNGILAPILSASPGRVDVIAPYEIAGQTKVTVQLSAPRYNQIGRPYIAPVRESAPAMRTTVPTAHGQAYAVQVIGTSRTLNDISNPAPKGAAVELYTTGAGAWQRQFLGDVPVESAEGAEGNSWQWNFIARPVSITIGGSPARILYAGTAYFKPWGMLQVNAIIPDDIPSGPQPVVLKIGDYDNAAQGVTLAIQ